MSWRTQVLPALLLCVAVIGCSRSSPTGQIELSKNASTVRSQILERVPLGTPLKEAEEKMRQMGFRCELRKAAMFDDESRGRRQYQRFEKIDYLACSREETGIEGIRHHLWVVALACSKEEMVTNVFTQVLDRTLAP